MLAALRLAVDVIQSVEWDGFEQGPTGAHGPACPVCFVNKGLPHSRTCRLNEALSAIRPLLEGE